MTSDGNHNYFQKPGIMPNIECYLMFTPLIAAEAILNKSNLHGQGVILVEDTDDRICSYYTLASEPS